MPFLSLIFALIGIASTVIGLGGGTTYLIFMELFQIPLPIIPVVALASNIIVSGTGAIIRLIRKEHYSLSLLIKILIPSMSLAYLGASFSFQEQFYRLILNILILLIILIRIFLQYRVDRRLRLNKEEESKNQPAMKTIVLMSISGAVGFTSGLIGIGGGIILGPILYLSGMSYKRIPLITAIYIFLNSIVGIIAKLQNLDSLTELKPYIILPIVSALSSMFTMFFVTYRITSNQVKIIVMCTIGFLSIYNVARLAVVYG